MKFAQDRFIKAQHEIISTIGFDSIDNPLCYYERNVLFLKEEATWNYILHFSDNSNLKMYLDNAFKELAIDNPFLKDCFKKDFFSNLEFDSKQIKSLIEVIDTISDEIFESSDLVGHIYEYVIRYFALEERKSKGEYYTPKSVSKLMVEMVEPYYGNIYDFCCGSGSLLIEVAKFLRKNKTENNSVNILAQEVNPEIYKLAKINMAIRGVKYDLGERNASSLSYDLHKDVKADFILTNPPFNVRNWKDEVDYKQDNRFKDYTLSKNANANYIWVLHALSKLNSNGVAALLLSNNTLNSDEDFVVRKKLIEQDKIEAVIILPREMFYSTDISVSLLIFNNNKKEQKHNSKKLRNRENEILFMDLRTWNSHKMNRIYVVFDDDEISKAKQIFWSWRELEPQHEYHDIKEICSSVNIDIIRQKNYSLLPSQYINFENKNSEINHKEILDNNYKELILAITHQKETHKQLLQAFERIGYVNKED